MWEDERNKDGGRWLINLNKNQRQTDLDNFWLETVSISNLCICLSLCVYLTNCNAFQDITETYMYQSKVIALWIYKKDRFPIVSA